MISIEEQDGFEKENIWKILKPMKKASWGHREKYTSIKSPKDYFQVYKAICYAGLNRDPRFPTKHSLEKLILEFDFKNAERRWHLQRGRQQAFTYRINRIKENSNAFLSGLRTTNTNKGFNFEIDFVFTVFKSPDSRMTYHSQKIGCVIAGNYEDAINIANMLYAPFFQNEKENISVAHSDVPILKEDTSYFFKAMSNIIQENNSKIKDLKEAINNLKDQIKDVENINMCINLNSAAHEN